LKTAHGRYQDVRRVVVVGIAGKNVDSRYTQGVGGLSLEQRVGSLSEYSKLQIGDAAGQPCCRLRRGGTALGHPHALFKHICADWSDVGEITLDHVTKSSITMRQYVEKVVQNFVAAEPYIFCRSGVDMLVPVWQYMSFGSGNYSVGERSPLHVVLEARCVVG
jgi:hypothetical protein